MRVRRDKYFWTSRVHAFVTDGHFIQDHRVCMKVGRISLEKSAILAFGDVGEACLDVVEWQDTTYTGDARSEKGGEGSHIQAGEELEWIRRIYIKKGRRSKVSGDPFVGNANGCLQISRQPHGGYRQIDGSPHQASKGFHRQLPT